MANEGFKDLKIEINTNLSVPPLPNFSDKTKINVRYALVSPYVFVHIYWDKKENEIKYEIEEPILNEEEKKDLEKISFGIREVINMNIMAEKNKEDLIDHLNKTAQLVISEIGVKVNEESYKKMFWYLYRNFVGLNEAEPIINDYFVEDIECNGIDTPIYVVHRVYRNIKTNVSFKDLDYLASFVEKLAQRCGRYISYASPLLDGSLPDGSRVNATYTKDITSRGPTFTIRKFTKIPWTPIQLISMNTLSPEMLAYLWLLIENKSNLLIAGGTASGKTTLLNAVSFFVPPEARIVSIEDTRELNLSRENWLPSVARTAIGTHGAGEVDLFSLLKNSFRQNPDYVIVGEVRGKEAFVLFQGMASGHASISTIHADSVQTVIQRLETPPIELSPTLVNTLDVVITMTHAVVKNKETRRLRQISEIVNVTPEGIATTNTPLIWNPADDKFYFKKDSKIFEKICQRKGISRQEMFDEFELRVKFLFALYKKKILDFESVQKEINEYYKNKEQALKKYNLI